LTGTVVHNLDGTSIATYEIAVAGEYTVNVLLGEDHVQGSPFNVVASAGEPVGKKCTKSFEGTLRAVAGVPFTFDVQARDKFGNAVTCGGHAFTISASGNATVSIVDKGDGTYTCHYCGSAAGKHILTVSLDDMPIGSGSIPVVVVPGEVHAACTTASGTGLSEPVIAGTPSVFTIQTRDQCENKCLTGSDPQRFSVKVGILIAFELLVVFTVCRLMALKQRTVWSTATTTAPIL